MREAYGRAFREIAASLDPASLVLDCGASTGSCFDELSSRCGIQPAQYRGLEWNGELAEQARTRGLQVERWDLNRGLPQADDTFTCVYGLSVLEHLLNGCRFMRDCRRVLKPGGSLVLLTPNISTYFTAALILAGKMPSSGPHPDSDALLSNQELFRVQSELIKSDTERDTPQHRHLVVFSYRVLREYLGMLGFTHVRGYGFGVYPFPNFLQPLMEKIDPFHAHQMVFVAQKPA